MNKYFIVFPLALVLAGCDREEPTYTVAQFKANQEQRQSTIAACKNNPGEKALTPNCINAQQAANEISNARRGLSPLKPLQRGE